MPLRLLAPDTEKRKAKRGVTPGRSKTHWPKRPYKDFTKIKYSPFIKTGTGKKGMLQEQAGAPGGEKKLHDKSMKRLNELQKLKSREGTRMTSGAQKKRKEHLQSGGYKAGGRANFRRGGKGTGPSPGTRIKARKARAAEWWTGREGKQAVYNPTLDKKLREKRPHSSPEGRMRDVRTAYAKAAEEHKRIKDSGIKRTWGKPGTRKYGGGAKTAQRAKHAVGGIIKKVISKIKPKGVFKPNGEGKVNKRFLDFIKTGKHVDKHGVKVNVPKAAERLTGKPHVDHGKRKRTKHLGKGKAEGGRIGLKHGGSVGAAIRGHGAEIK